MTADGRTVANTLLNHLKKNHHSTNWDSILPFVFDLMGSSQGGYRELRRTTPPHVRGRL